MVYSPYYPHINSKYIEYIITPNRDFNVDLFKYTPYSQIIRSDTIGLYYQTPYPPTPKLHRNWFNIDENKIIISIPFV